MVIFKATYTTIGHAYIFKKEAGLALHQLLSSTFWQTDDDFA